MMFHFLLAISLHFLLSSAISILQNATEDLRFVDSNQMSYGVAVGDVDHDGRQDWIVAGFTGPNLVLKYEPESRLYTNIALPGSPFAKLRDEKGQALGVAVCDITGDGREEIYFVNGNMGYGGQILYRHSLFHWRDGEYVDLFEDDVNKDKTIAVSGRSVGCVDHFGSGVYSFVVPAYAARGKGSYLLIEMDPERSNPSAGVIAIRDTAKEAGIARTDGGRVVLTGPLLGNGALQDIFILSEPNEYLDNEGRNFLFRNKGDGTFHDVTDHFALRDSQGSPRATTIVDYNRDGIPSILSTNYGDTARLWIPDGLGWTDVGNEVEGLGGDIEEAGKARVALTADFDNDGKQELFLGAFPDPPPSANNRLLHLDVDGRRLTELDPGPSLEPEGYNTGGAICDLDGDGSLEMLLTHGEDKAQPLSLYEGIGGGHWIRIMPLTAFGAPARGALVNVTFADGDSAIRIIDPGTYLSHDEPVAHIGWPQDGTPPINLRILWPGGKALNHRINEADWDKLHRIPHPNFYGHDEL